MSKIEVGDVFPFESLESVSGSTVSLRGGSGIFHLYLGRFSGCSACNFNLKQLANKYDEFKKAAIKNVVVIHSPKDTIMENQGSKFGWTNKIEFVADPQRETYRKVGADMDVTMMLTWYVFTAVTLAKTEFQVKDRGIGEGVSQRPLDLLLDAKSGKVLEKFYGSRPSDAWSPAQVIELSKKHSA